MERGFKKKSEDQALIYRNELGLMYYDPLPAETLARKLRIQILTPRDIPNITPEILNQLTRTDSNSWSALTISNNGLKIIIHNPHHSQARQESNLMHEIAHILCEHRPSQFVQLDGFPFSIRTCDKTQEEEARWLGGCLQIPRRALVWAFGKNMDASEISEHYSASKDLVKYRINMTGVRIQFSRQGFYRKRKGNA